MKGQSATGSADRAAVLSNPGGLSGHVLLLGSLVETHDGYVPAEFDQTELMMSDALEFLLLAALVLIFRYLDDKRSLVDYLRMLGQKGRIDKLREM